MILVFIINDTINKFLKIENQESLQLYKSISNLTSVFFITKPKT